MQNVKIDRDKFIGSSDIPIIMNLSPFKTRFELLQEKAGLIENTFEGNKYTEYGNIMEEKIRNFINTRDKKKFVEDKVEIEDRRSHGDGFDTKEALEIKTTSQIKEKVEDYKTYLVQLLDVMNLRNIKKGRLEVYKRPEDFNTEFDEERLLEYKIDIKNYKDLVEDINTAIEMFRVDLEKIKANPFITEEDLQPKEIIELSNKILKLEEELEKFKEIEEEQKGLKEELKLQMEKYRIKKWNTDSGIKITRVLDTPDKTETVIDIEKMIEENQELAEKYKKEVIKKGKKGYIKIS